MSRLSSRLRRVPAAGWWCAAIALVNAVVWSLVVPPLHVPDESSHVTYVQYLAEEGRPPKGAPLPTFSTEQQRAMDLVRFETVVYNGSARPPWTSVQDAAIHAELAGALPRDNGGGASNVSSNPPLYYAAAAVPYRLASSGDFLARVQWMRLVSVLLAGLTVLLSFLFVREVLPGTPWAWTVGGLAAAFQPVLGFMSAGVNNDNGLFAAAAATFLVLARMFRRGVTVRRGWALGAVLVLGLGSKVNMVGLLPGVAVALAILTWRAGPGRRTALRAAGVAAGTVAAAGLAYLVLVKTVWDRALFAGAGSVTETPQGKTFSYREMAGYLWQFYLPRLPFQTDQFAQYPLWEVWFKGWIGRFGWLDHGFPPWAYTLAGGLFAGVLGLAAAGAARARRWLGRDRVLEALAYAACAASLLALLGVAGYRYRVDTGFVFEQGRYLVPLLPLYAAVVALAARGAGRRWGPAVGGALVVLAMAHGLFAQLLSVSRYYG